MKLYCRCTVRCHRRNLISNLMKGTIKGVIAILKLKIIGKMTNAGSSTFLNVLGSMETHK